MCNILFLKMLAVFIICYLNIANASAQNYPNKTVRVIVPTAPGGGADMQARLLAKVFQESMGQQFLIDNRPGASGIIGADYVAKSAADGYTLLVSTSYLATNISFFTKMPFDALKDLIPISQISYAPQFLIVHPSLPVKTLNEFIRLAKNNPNLLNAGSSGNGSANHLAVEMLQQAAGIKCTHVPYKSGAPAITALVSGEVAFTFTGGVTALPFIRMNKVRALAVSSLTPSAAMPTVPTIHSVYPGFESSNWYGLFAPTGLNSNLINKLSNEVQKALKVKDVHANLMREGAEPVGSTSQIFTSYFRQEVERYARLIKSANVKID